MLMVQAHLVRDDGKCHPSLAVGQPSDDMMMTLLELIPIGCGQNENVECLRLGDRQNCKLVVCTGITVGPLGLAWIAVKSV